MAHPSTKPSPLLRSSIKIRKAGDEVEAEPGFFEGDTVANCGPSLKGEFARTLNLTDVHTGWVFTRSIRNNAHILGALRAADLEIFFTRSRPYKKNDQATIEFKNNHLVRKYGFYYRYDTAEERAVLNRLLEAGVLGPAQAAYRDSLNPAAIGREIADLQAVLLKLAKHKTEQLYLATFPSALPEVRAGIRINKNKVAS